jgi:hypothetical protein
VDLCRRLDQVLQVCPASPLTCVDETRRKANKPGKEVAQVSKLAVVRVLNIHNTPAVLATANGLAINDHIVF